MDPIKYEKTEDIKLNDKPELSLGFKPKGASIITLIVGVILAVCGIVFGRIVALIILGCLFILMSFIGELVVKDYKTIDFYNDGIVVYKYMDQNFAFFRKYDEIAEWTTKRTEQGADAVWFKFNDETQVYKDTFQCKNAYRYMIKRLPDIESNQIRMKNLRARQMSFPEAIEYWRNKLLKKANKKEEK